MADIYEIKYNDKGDFFDSYPDFLAIKEVKNLFVETQAKVKGDVRTNVSKMMWSIYFVYHHNSIWIKKPIEVRIEFVNNNFIGVKGWWSRAYPMLEPVIKIYLELLDDAPERLLICLYDKLDERNKMIRNTPYQIYDDKGVEIKGAKANAEWLDKMIIASSDLVNEVRRVEATLHKTNDRQIKGGKQLGLHAKGELNGIPNEKSDFVQKAIAEAKRDAS